MDFSTEHGFTKKNTARDLWDKAMDIYRTAESKGQRINREYA